MTQEEEGQGLDPTILGEILRDRVEVSQQSNTDTGLSFLQDIMPQEKEGQALDPTILGEMLRDRVEVSQQWNAITGL